MVPQDHGPLVDFATLDDATLVALARAGRREAFRQIMQRCNRRLFRVARGVVHDDAEAEDMVQAAYVSAFEHLAELPRRGLAGDLAHPHRPQRGQWPLARAQAHGRVRHRSRRCSTKEAA